ncbi:hypothetical protein [Natribacillus halophilus]|uniref:hypothetical protein n=1 Tax=Natribacillus halophilus TaxID=549003 RepID=UPI0015A2D608|nr:hypothetical protein [Natribacillus halophilus]
MAKLKDKKALGMFGLAIVLAMGAGIFAVYGHMLWIVTLIVSQIVLIMAFWRIFMSGN